MTTQISVETISPFTHNQIPVITTELLAQLYGTEILNIQVNFTRNKERFVEGKHFFKASGEELKNLRLTLSKSQNPISPKARPSPYGQNAEQHATQKCWKPFRRGKCSKNSKTVISAKNSHQQHKTPPTQNDGYALLIHLDKHGQVEFTEKIPADAMVCTLERFLSGATRLDRCP